MRKGLFIVGIVLAVIGAILAAVAFVGPGQSVNIPPVSSQSAEVLTVNFIGSGTVSLSWTGGSSGTTVEVYSCSDSSCSSSGALSGGGNVVARGSGASGSISFASSGTSYYAVIESGSAGGVTATAKLSGLTTLSLIGLILLVLGAIVAVLGWRLAPRVVVAGEEEPETPEGSNVPPPGTYGSSEPAPSTTSSGTYTPPPSVYTLPPQPEQAEEGSGSGAAVGPARMTTAPPTAPGARPPVQCKNCGTWNEAWITNCRWCKRTLSSTGGG
ncbi:MAG: hypothetical protein L3K09_06790 [Thermoplasmata archaeon]|nr:hypothetical protein [Thermoplasmata archaeon]